MSAHPIPDAALEADIATLAQKGAGKTYLNKGLVERLLHWKRRVIIMDPLNVWWGLQAMADGSPGFPVVVIGGPNADVPLDPTRGRELGEYCARADIRAVIDVSELKAGQLVSFSTAFLGELYRLNRDPLWLVLEEADVFAPQNPQGTESFMLHEVDQIARRGRQRGFRLWTICQRPQELNKKTLTQASTLVLMRLRAPQDRKAAEAWIVGHGSKEQAAEISSTLASLQVGEGYVWAPDLDLLARVKFPPIATLDNSATPKAGDKRPSKIRLAKPDLAELLALAAPQASHEPDPRPPSGGSAVTRASFAAELEAAEQRGLERGLAAGEERGMRQGLAIMLTRAQSALRDLRIDDVAISSTAPEASKIDVAAKPPPAPRTNAAPKAAPTDGITGPQQRVLDAIAWWRAFDIVDPTIEQVAFVAGYSASSSGYANLKGAMRSAGLVDYPAPGRITLTTSGSRACRPPEGPTTLEAFHDAVRAKLSGPQQRLLNPMLEAFPAARTSTELAEASGYSASSSGFANLKGQMRSLGFIDYPAPGQVRAAGWLFP